VAEFVKIADLTYRFEQELQQANPLRPAQLVEFALKLDPLRTLVLPEDTDADSIAGTVDASGISHILVRGAGEELVGVIDVSWARQRTQDFLSMPVKSFSDTVDAILQRPGYGGTFHHEWLTLDRPPIVWCDGGHFADKNPCDLHRG
jgi:hypothetical protein